MNRKKCRVPKVVCTNCGGCGYWQAHVIYVCWNNRSICDLTRTVTHELVHASQVCFQWRYRDCADALAWELQAYFCSKACNTFHDCYLKAVRSACIFGPGSLCDPNKVAELYERMELWFEVNRGIMCPHPDKPPLVWSPQDRN